MKALILGQGRLSTYLLRSFQHSPQIKHSASIPSRDLSLEQLIDSIYNYTPNIVIDLLDPSMDRVPRYQNICLRNLSFRNALSTIPIDFSYFYCSSANLYELSTSLINESSPLIKEYTSEYLKQKSFSEAIISEYSEKMSILRIPSIWYHDYLPVPSRSFFDDLNLAISANHKLPFRAGDHQPFSYILAIHAATAISQIVTTKLQPIVNVTANQWSTRFYLKNNLQYVEKLIPGLRITTMYNLCIDNA